MGVLEQPTNQQTTDRGGHTTHTHTLVGVLATGLVLARASETLLYYFFLEPTTSSPTIVVGQFTAAVMRIPIRVLSLYSYYQNIK